MITKHKEVYFKTIIWHTCYHLFYMEVYLGTKDVDVVVYFYVNTLLLAGYLTLGCGASSTVFKIDQLFNFRINSAENDSLHTGRV